MDEQAVSIFVEGMQRLPGETAYAPPIRTETAGILRTAAGKRHILYKDGDGTKTHLVLGGTCVELHRRGTTETDMIFSLSGDTECMYLTAAGGLAFKVRTKSLREKMDGGGIRIRMEYDLLSGGEAVSENLAEIRIHPMRETDNTH